MSIYNAVERLQNMKFPGMASDVDEKGRTAEEKAEKGAPLVHWPVHVLRNLKPLAVSMRSHLGSSSYSSCSSVIKKGHNARNKA